MRLYHFTSDFHWPQIVQARHIRTTHNSLEPFAERGPQVVWLSGNPDYGDQDWATGAFFDKAELRITVEIPEAEAHLWSVWSREHSIKEVWYAALGQYGNPDEWVVVERAIPISEWVEVHRHDHFKNRYLLVSRPRWDAAHPMTLLR